MATEESSPPAPPSTKETIQQYPYLLIFVLLVVESLHFVFARALSPILNPYTSAFYVLAVSTVEMGIYIGWRHKFEWRLLREKWLFFAAIGFLVAVSTDLNYIAVEFVDAGTASLLSKASIVFAMLLGLTWLRERLTTLQWIGAIVALIGTFVVSFQPGDFGRIGSLMVLAGSFMYALHAAIVKQYGDEMDFLNFFFFRILMTSFFLGVFAAGQGELVWVSNGRHLLLLIFVGTVDVVISRLLYYFALRKLNLSIHAIFLTLSPVFTIGWSLLLFGERPSLQGFLGGTAVLLGVMGVSWANQRKVARSGQK